MIARLLAVFVLGLAAAYPEEYEEHGKSCEIPTETFGPHAKAGEIVPVDTITFEVQDVEGNLVMAWRAGETYSITVGAFSDAPVFLWVHSTLGTFAEPAKEGCESATFVGSPDEQPAVTHTFEWTAPAEDGTECAVVSTAQSSGPNVAYRTGTIDFCPESAAAPAPAPAVASAPAVAAQAPAPVDAPAPATPSPMESPAPNNPAAAPTESSAFEGSAAGEGSAAAAGSEATSEINPSGATAIAGYALAATFALAAIVAL